jgi:phage gp29-like protein
MPNKIVIGKNARGYSPNSRIRNKPNVVGYKERLDLVANSITPADLSSILSQSTQGDLRELHEAYDKMELDPQVGGVIDHVCRTLSGSRVKYDPRTARNTKEQSLSDEYHALGLELLENINARTLIREFVKGVMRGVKAYQPKYVIEKYGNKYLAIPTELKPVQGQRYLWETEYNTSRYGEFKIVTSKKSDGVYINDMPKGDIFFITDGYGLGRWDLNGVNRRVLGYWLLKSYATSWWGDKVEMFGEPIRIGRYPQGTSTEIRNEAEMFLAEMGRTAYALLPDNVNLQLLESASSSNGGLSTHGEIVRYLDNRIAFTYLGQTDSNTDSRYGSKARSKELGNITASMIKDYASGVAEGFEKLLCAVIYKNYGTVVKRLVPKARLLHTSIGDITDKTEAMLLMADNGVAVPVETFYEESGVELPQKGQKVLLRGTVQDYDESKSEPENNEVDSKSEGSDNGREKDDTGDSEEENS